jgi:hypothetical protein
MLMIGERKMSYNLSRIELTPKQQIALLALLSGHTQIEAARMAHVHENQVCMWMKEPLFVETLHAAEAERVQELNWSLIALAKKATKALEDVLDNAQALDPARIRAADVVLTKLLNLRELVTFEDRLRKLEEVANAQF